MIKIESTLSDDEFRINGRIMILTDPYDLQTLSKFEKKVLILFIKNIENGLKIKSSIYSESNLSN